MKLLTPESTRAIAKAVIPLNVPNYDRGTLHPSLWKIILDFASYAGFDVAPKLAEINTQIKDEWMKLTIDSIEESRKGAEEMDEFAGSNDWITDFEKNLKDVMAI